MRTVLRPQTYNTKKDDTSFMFFKTRASLCLSWVSTPCDVFSQYLQINNNSGDYDLKTSIGIINLFDEKAPRLYNAPDFSWDSRLHDPRGRMIRVNFQLIFDN